MWLYNLIQGQFYKITLTSLKDSNGLKKKKLKWSFNHDWSSATILKSTLWRSICDTMIKTVEHCDIEYNVAQLSVMNKNTFCMWITKY